MIKITFPDGGVREYEAGVNALLITKGLPKAKTISLFAYHDVFDSTKSITHTTY